MALIGVVVVGLAFVAIYQVVIHPIFLSPIANVPAVHPLAKLTPLYMLWLRYWEQENETVFEAHQKYGDVVRLGPSELSVNCVDDGIKTIYGKNFDRHYFYRVYEDCGRLNLASSLDAISHGIRKRRVTHVYSKSYLHNSPAVAGVMNRVIRQRFLSLVAGCAQSQLSFDSMSVFSALILDVLTGYTFGVKNGTNFLENRDQHEWLVEEIHKGRPFDMMFWLHEFPGLIFLFERIGLLSKARYKSLEALQAFCLGMCARAEAALTTRSKEETAEEDFPTVYQQFKRALDKEGFGTAPSVLDNEHAKLSSQMPSTDSLQQSEIASEVCDQIHASDETMSVTLTYAIWELSRDPQMQQRLRDECQALGSDYTRSMTTLPSASAVDALPLLHAIVMETMRVHPVVAGGQARVTPYGKLSKLGRFEHIPGGYRVQSYARFLHENPDVFPDPLAWHPERWLQSATDIDTEGPDQKMRWFWAFSSGARMCLGSHLALLVMKYVLLSTYSTFETYIVDDDGIEHMKGFVGGPQAWKLMVGARPLTRVES